MSTPVTSKDCLREAFAALLRGDTWKRDRMCESARIMMAHEAVDRVLEIDFYVTARGQAIPTVLMAEQAGVTR